MEQYINNFGETVTAWTSHKHPDNPNFMQLVYWRVYEKNGKTTVLYSLSQNNPQAYYELGMTKEEAIAKFTDPDNKPATEQEFNEWLKNQKP